MAASPPTSAPWHARSVDAVVAALGTDLERGLAPEEAARRLQRVGPNTPATSTRAPWWEEPLEALTEPLVLLLLAVAALYALLGELRDALTILAVILAVAGVEVANERRARRAIAALRRLSEPTAALLRGGRAVVVPIHEIVPGDLVLLQPGRRVPADLRLTETVALRIDESSLTGESAPAAKQAAAILPAETELGDRVNLAYAGTIVLAGRGRGVVVATGRLTELGRIADLAAAAREPRTPLQRYLRQLSGWLLWLAVGLSVLVPVLGVLVAGQPPREMVLTGLTLAFATIPEELPILITLVLGLGAYQLARQRAIVKRLRAAETLGSISTIGTDKTGTLTEHRMRVVEVRVPDRPAPAEPEATQRLLEIGVLANDAEPGASADESRFVGDPTETALLAAAEQFGLDVAGLRAAARVLETFPFDDVRKRMAVVYELAGARWLALKGAPETVLAVCQQVRIAGATELLDAGRRQRIIQTAEAMAARGLRVLGFAEGRLSEATPLTPAALERDLTFVGLAGLADPPRPEARAAIAALQAAGVRVLMLTGDHPNTARAIAEQVGIDARQVVLGREIEACDDASLEQLVVQASVFARIAPEHKLRIVRALAARGEVVAVTGDGVNDAPALRAAAIGVAMGQSGTDVAREAADLILADDNFATIAAAVRAGRLLHANLRKAIRYYLAAKLALIGASLVAVLARLPVPFAPIQIILLELLLDLGASTTFVAEPPEQDLLSRPPRDPRKPFVDHSLQLGILGGGASLAAAVLASFFWAWSQGSGVATAQTAAFATWIIGHLALAASMRTERQALRLGSPRTNTPFALWALAALLLLGLGASLPLLQARLHLTALPAHLWAVALGAGLLPLGWWEVWKWRCRGRILQRD